jgi:hypothetical protein
MQREIAFDAFATTTLQGPCCIKALDLHAHWLTFWFVTAELGIVSGSAMFRMVRAASSSGGSAAPVALSTVPPPTSPAAAPPKEEPAAPPSASTAARSWTEEEEKHSAPPPAPVAVVALVPPAVSQPLPQPSKSVTFEDDVDMTPPPDVPVAARLSSYDALQLLRDSCFDSVSRTAVMTLMKIVTNVLSYPGKFLTALQHSPCVSSQTLYRFRAYREREASVRTCVQPRL